VSYLIGVAGYPGSGKSSLVAALADALGEAPAVRMDDYENMTRMPIAALVRWMNDGADIDAFAFPRLEEQLRRLKASRDGFALFETQFGRAHRATGQLIDLLIWVDTPLDVALARNVRATVSGLLREPNADELPGRLRWLHGYLDNYLGIVRSLLVIQKERVMPGAEIIVDGGASLADMVRSAKTRIQGGLA
jgi:uridine kinase